MHWPTSDTLLVPVATVLWLSKMPALSYIGPGAGLTAIGAFLAAVAGVIIAIFGFVWYPIKRLLRKKRTSSDQKPEQGE